MEDRRGLHSNRSEGLRNVHLRRGLGSRRDWRRGGGKMGWEEAMGSRPLLLQLSVKLQRCPGSATCQQKFN